MLPSTRIRRQTVRNLVRYRGASPEALGRRLARLDREWDIERAVWANAGSVALAGLVLGAFVDRRFLLLPAAASAVLVQQSRRGWSPLVPVLRRLGFRSPHEIEAERRVLLRMGQPSDTNASEAEFMQ